jgi:hypothetical protein
MRFLPPAFYNEIIQQEFTEAILLSIELVESTLNITTWNSPISYDSIIYYPRAFKISPVNYGDAKIVSDVNVDIDDADRGLFSSFGQYDAAAYPFKLTWVVLNEFGLAVSALVIFVGVTDHWEYKPGGLSFVAVSVLNQWTRETTSRFSESCRWRIFKGIECKYVGSGTTCDRTFDQCKAYGNEDNFGGQRWLPGMINKKLESK